MASSGTAHGAWWIVSNNAAQTPLLTAPAPRKPVLAFLDLIKEQQRFAGLDVNTSKH